MVGLAPGTQLGSYRISGELSRGSMGQVYAAVHEIIGRRVAIKVIAADLARSPGALELFFREARTANRIAHPNIIQVTDLIASRDHQPTFMVMELLEGETLADRIARRGRLRAGEVVAIARQVADAMVAAHAAGIVHRDLKPDNLFLTRRAGGDFVKVLDFGVANLISGGKGPTPGPPMLCGTPLYMSPEQARLEPTDERTDIYSLGAVLYEAITGRPVFQEDSLRRLRRAHIAEPPVRPSLIHGGPGAPPPRLEKLIMSCLSKRRSERPSSMGPIVRELDAIAAELGAVRRSPELAVTLGGMVSSSPDAARGRVTLAAVSAILAAAVSFWALGERDRDAAWSARDLSTEIGGVADLALDRLARTPTVEAAAAQGEREIRVDHPRDEGRWRTLPASSEARARLEPLACERPIIVCDE
jgi:serine/threonine-protein kinase